MADYAIPVKNEAFVFFVSLVSQADTKLAQTNPTLAAGDVKVQTDDGTLANITTLPTGAASSKRVKVSLSASEMNGDNIWVQFSDAAGAEWCDLGVCIQTAARGVDDLAYPATSGRSLQVETDGMVHADLKEWLGTAPLALVAQRVSADMTAISGDATAADNLESYTDGTTPIPANATQISGDATAADNLEAAADGTGFNLGGGAVVAASVTGAVGSVTGNVGGNVVGSVASVSGNVGGNVTGSVGSLAAQAKADVNAEVDSALDTAIPGSPTADSINQRIRSMDLLTEAGGAGDLAAILVDTGTTLQGELDGIEADVDAILLDTGTDGVVVAAGSKTGYSLSAAGVQAIWDALTAALTTAGSVGKRIADFLTGDAFVRLGAPAGASTAADIAAVKADTAATLADTGTDGVVVAAASKTGYALSSSGLDSVAMAEPSVAPTAGSTFLAKVAWLVQRFLRADMTSSVLTTKQIGGATVSTQALTDNGTTQTVGPPA